MTEYNLWYCFYWDESGSSSDDSNLSEDQSDYDDDEELQHWDETEDDIDRDIGNRNRDDQHTNKNRAHQFVLWILCSLLHIQNAFLLTNACIEKRLHLFCQVFYFFAGFNILFQTIANCFPHSIYRFRKLIDFDRDDFMKYVVCLNCTSLYRYDDVVQNRDGRTIVNKCTNIMFGCRVDKSSPNHGRRGKYRCDAKLVQEVQLSNNKQNSIHLKHIVIKMLSII